MAGGGPRISFGFMDSLLAEVAGIPQAALHLDVDAILRAYEAVQPIARRLGIDPPRPRLAGLAYPHVSTLGCKVTISYDAQEPYVTPCIRRPEDIDHLAEPADYLAGGIVPQRLALCEQIQRRCPEAPAFVGHDYQGPVTTAALLMGQDFFMLPYDDPARAHRLLDFCVRSALNYSRAIRTRLGQATGSRPVGMPDDFAGMFPPEVFAEFVVPYWERMYAGQQATRRHLHCEMLREGHLRYLAGLKISEYDPSVDHYLAPQVLQRSCPVPYGLRIWPSEVVVRSPRELADMYRRLAGFGPTFIMFHLDSLANLPKIEAILQVARRLE